MINVNCEWNSRNCFKLDLQDEAGSMTFRYTKDEFYKILEAILTAARESEFIDPTPEEQIIIALFKNKIETADGKQWGKVRQMTEEEYKEFLSTTESEDTDNSSVKFRIEFYNYERPGVQLGKSVHLCSAKRVLDQILEENWVIAE